MDFIGEQCLWVDTLNENQHASTLYGISLLIWVQRAKINEYGTVCWCESIEDNFLVLLVSRFFSQRCYCRISVVLKICFQAPRQCSLTRYRNWIYLSNQTENTNTTHALYKIYEFGKFWLSTSEWLVPQALALQRAWALRVFGNVGLNTEWCRFVRWQFMRCK